MLYEVITTVVAEQFGKTSDFKTPKIESTGSGGGLKLVITSYSIHYTKLYDSWGDVSDVHVRHQYRWCLHRFF